MTMIAGERAASLKWLEDNFTEIMAGVVTPPTISLLSCLRGFEFLV